MMNMQYMQHRPPDDNLTAYYEPFNRRTNHGKVFIDDLSSAKDVNKTTLTPLEHRVRVDYQRTLSLLVRDYPLNMTHPIATTKEEVLQQRIVAPYLEPSDDVSNRSGTTEARAGRIYPPNIYPWTDFQEAVEGYHLDSSIPLNDEMNLIFYSSLDRAGRKCCDEADELGNLLNNLDRTLKVANIIHDVKKGSQSIGKMDFCVMKDNATISIICECKSTHNLLLPMKADDCKAAYDNAYNHGAQSKVWSKVAHPIGQLLGYLVEKGHRYGALTTGTKTHFVMIQSPDVDSSGTHPDIHAQNIDTGYHVATRSRAKKMKTTTAFASLANTNETSKEPSMVTRAARNLFGAFKAGSRRESMQKGATKRKSNEENSNVRSTNVDVPKEEVTAGSECKKPAAVATHEEIFEMDSDVKVCISNAWCVGEANYLRAWAYMHTLHESSKPWKAPTDWIKSSSKISTPSAWRQKHTSSRTGRNRQGKSTSRSDMRSSSNDYRGNSAKSCNLDHYYPIHKGKLEYVPFDDIVFLDALGNGRNGACFKVQWNGTECALKQFDIGRDGDTNFEKEIEAYMLLQEAWGILVPRPLFLSESYSGGRLLLGLQLGHESTSDNDLLKFQHVLQQIEMKYGIRHNDAECGRNMIIITDTNGFERVAAIDFEDWVKV